MRPGTPGFIGERLREAREARALTAVALADLVGVTRAAVSQYEKGRQSPGPLVLHRIAESLEVPLHFFLRAADSEEPGTIFYRSMSSATKRARKSAQRRLGWLRRIVAFLRQYVRFPALAFPECSLSNDPAEITSDLVERAAVETRSLWGLGDGPISNMLWLLENHGAVVTRWDLGARSLDAFSKWSPFDNRPYLALTSGKSCAVRSRFDSAHELGHMVLHRYVDKGILVHPDSFRRLERQADRFAGAFLLPKQQFTEDFYSASLDALRAIKGKWRVSIQAMIKRAAALELISGEQEKRLWVGLSRRKWRTREPLDDVFEPEAPKFLRKSVDLLITKRVVSPTDIPFELSLSARDIEQLTGLDIGYFSTSEPEIELLAEDENGVQREAPIIPFPRSPT